MRNSIGLTGQGFNYLNQLIRNKSFLWAYIICFGLYDVASALFATQNPDDIINQYRISLYIGVNLGIFMKVFVLLLISRKEAAFSGRTLANIWNVWKADFIAGLYIVIGLLLFIVPGIVLALRYLYVTEAVLLEECRINEALRRSRKLFSVNGGKIFWATALITVIYIVIVFVCTFVISLASETALDSFAYNYFLDLSATAMAVILAGSTYAGYTDACEALNAKKLESKEIS